MKIKKKQKNCYTIQNVCHTTHKWVYTLQNNVGLTNLSSQKCQPRVFWLGNRYKQCTLWPCCVVSGLVSLVAPCLVLSGFILSCLILACLVLSWRILSCLVLYCRNLGLSRLVLSCLVLTCLVLSCVIMPCLILSCLGFDFIVLPCVA